MAEVTRKPKKVMKKGREKDKKERVIEQDE